MRLGVGGGDYDDEGEKCGEGNGRFREISYVYLPFLLVSRLGLFIFPLEHLLSISSMA